MEKAWPQRGRESTLTALHSCHRTRIPFGHVLIERRCLIKHCKRGCNKEKKDQPHHKQQQKGTVSKTQKQNNKTCENCDPMKFELSYIQRHNNGRRGHREGGRTLTGPHICHRPRIPVGHVLIEHKCAKKHCKRERFNKEKKEPTHHKQQKVPFRTTKPKNITCEN
jgi:hypothetical protein